jgi:hypothetical protein
MKNERMAAWAAKKAAAVAKQIMDLPPAKDWRDAQRKAQVCARLRREESRWRALASRYAEAA